MNKALYIIGIVFAIIFLIVVGYYTNEVSKARITSLFNSLSYYEYDIGISRSASKLTIQAGMWSLVFFLFYIAMDILGLVKVKTRTSKVFSIIGLSFSGIFLLWNFAMLSSPGGISFNEVSPGWVIYCLIMLAFSIVGLVQSVRFARKGIQPARVSRRETTDLLDS